MRGFIIIRLMHTTIGRQFGYLERLWSKVQKKSEEKKNKDYRFKLFRIIHCLLKEFFMNHVQSHNFIISDGFASYPPAIRKFYILFNMKFTHEVVNYT